MPVNNTIISVWSTRAAEARIAVWPDGCRDIVVIGEPNQPTRVICTGLDSCIRQVVCKVGTLFFGIRVAPGVSFPWDENNPACKSSDVAVPELDKILRRRVRGIAQDPEGTLQLLEKAAQRWATPAPDWIAEYMQSLWNGDGGACSAGRFSERSFRRHLVQITGAPPRYWQGLARVRHVAREIALGNGQLADIAAKYQFSDQAHMSREIKRWFDCTPMMLRRNREQAAVRLSAPDAFQADRIKA